MAASPTPEQLAHYADGFNKSASLRAFGIRLELTPQKVIAHIDEVQTWHQGGLGEAAAVNGGVLAALFDLVLGCTPALIDPTRRCATVQISMSFERPTTGKRIRAEAWIETPGESTVFSAAQIVREDGQVTAHARGVVRFSKVKWSGGGTPAVN